MAGRGELTQEIKDLSLELLGYEINMRQLRLMPYLVHVLMNNQKIDPSKVNGEERGFIAQWKKEERLNQNHGLKCSPDFWEILNQIIYVAYVDFENRGQNENID